VVDPQNQSRPDQRESDPNKSYLSRERRKVAGLLILLIGILVLAFLRFGTTIPWGAR
jgi:hypothetical protein